MQVPPLLADVSSPRYHYHGNFGCVVDRMKDELPEISEFSPLKKPKLVEEDER